MKKVRFEIDLSGWELEIFDKMRGTLREATEKTLKSALEHGNTYIYFPFVEDDMGNTPVNDPLTVHLSVALESREFEEPTFEFNLRECLKSVMEACVEDTSYYEGLEKLMYALRGLADEIGVTLESIPDE